MQYNVGTHRLPEEIIQGVEFQDDGKAVVWYDYDGETRQCWTKSPFDRDDLRGLLDVCPELAWKNGEPVMQVIESKAVPQVAVPVKSEGYAVYLNNVETHDPSTRIICDTLDQAQQAVNKAVLDPDHPLSAWKGTVYALSDTPQPGSPFGASDFTQLLYERSSK